MPGRSRFGQSHLPFLEGLAVTDCVEGPVTPLSSGTATATRSPETPMCGSSSPSAKTTATRSPATPVCGSSTPSAKTFVLRSVLKKPGKLFSENGKVRVTLPKAKEFRDVCFRAVREIHVSHWCAGKPSLVCHFLKSQYYSEIGSVFK